jgi:hypothetical protein
MEHVDRHPPPLRARRTAPSGVAPGVGERIGLAGVLSGDGPAHRARAARPPGTAVDRGWRWNVRDAWSPLWWPQGVALGEQDGGPVALVSWFAQERRGARRGARVTVVDLRDERRPRYRHVLLVAVGPGGRLDPVPIHAGGIAWIGARLYVAATFGGIREFRLDDIARTAGPFGHRFVLPQHAEFAPEGARHERLRYSFVSAVDGDELVAGEYRADASGRIARLRVDDERAEVVEVFTPGIPQMQGVALRGGVWFVSASHGDRRAGDLWSGRRDGLVRREGAIPPGPEDVALDGDGRLWGVSEFPRRRWLYRLSVATDGSSGAAGR